MNTTTPATPTAIQTSVKHEIWKENLSNSALTRVGSAHLVHAKHAHSLVSDYNGEEAGNARTEGRLVARRFYVVEIIETRRELPAPAAD